jgi:type IV pilus assembly protein PilA
MAVDRSQLEPAIGRNADYYLRRFEQIDSGRRVGWNWAAFFLSTAWFSYRGLGGWAALNLAAPWVGMLLVAFTMPFSVYLGMLFLIVYPVVFFVLVPMYADALYYERVKRAVAHAVDGGKPSPPTRPVSATVVGLASVTLPALVLLIYQGAHVDYTPRAQVSEAISLMASAKTPIAEYFADKGKWPDNFKQVAENTSGRYTERVEITSGAGAASGALVMTATMRTSGVRSDVAGKTVQMRSEDEGKTWICSRGAANGVDNKYLPAACRSSTQ